MVNNTDPPASRAIAVAREAGKRPDMAAITVAI